MPGLAAESKEVSIEGFPQCASTFGAGKHRRSADDAAAIGIGCRPKQRIGRRAAFVLSGTGEDPDMSLLDQQMVIWNGYTDLPMPELVAILGWGHGKPASASRLSVGHSATQGQGAPPERQRPVDRRKGRDDLSRAFDSPGRCANDDNLVREHRCLLTGVRPLYHLFPTSDRAPTRLVSRTLAKGLYRHYNERVASTAAGPGGASAGSARSGFFATMV